MKKSLTAFIKFLQNYPRARLHLIYRIEHSDSGIAVHYTKDKVMARYFKANPKFTVKRRLICRTF